MFYLSFTAPNPADAVAIINVVLPVLEEKYKSLSLDNILRNKEFIEQQMANIGNQLERVRRELLDFQAKYGTTDFNAQANEQVKLIARLRSDIVINELEVQKLISYLPPDDPRVIRLKNENKQHEQLIKNLKTGEGLDAYPGEFIPQNDVPKLSMMLDSMRSEIDLLESIYSSLRNQYEMAKIRESDNARVFQIIQAAEIPRMKSSVSRSKTVIIVTLTAFIISVLLAFIIEYFKNLSTDTLQEAKIKKIKELFMKKK